MAAESLSGYRFRAALGNGLASSLAAYDDLRRAPVRTRDCSSPDFVAAETPALCGAGVSALTPKDLPKGSGDIGSPRVVDGEQPTAVALLAAHVGGASAQVKRRAVGRGALQSPPHEVQRDILALDDRSRINDELGLQRDEVLRSGPRSLQSGEDVAGRRDDLGVKLVTGRPRRTARLTGRPVSPTVYHPAKLSLHVTEFHGARDRGHRLTSNSQQLLTSTWLHRKLLDC